MKNLSRRRAIHAALFGAGGIGLRSLATGIPIGVLADPLAARAHADAPASTLILNTSSSGDSVGANAPGAYLDDIVHPSGAAFEATDVVLGGAVHQAARAWADFIDVVEGQICFLRHGTFTNSHTNQQKVMSLMGASRRSEMMVSHFSEALAPKLGSIQSQPISLGAKGNELLTFGGRAIANVSPRALKSILEPDDGPLADLEPIRQSTLDELNALLKERGTPNQQAVLERFAFTRHEAQKISGDLLNEVQQIGGDSSADQVIAASVLAAMNVSPVITLHMSFGGDNHFDANLDNEAEATENALLELADLHQRLASLRQAGGLTQDVTLASLNVFGRTLRNIPNHGRDHNSRQHCMFIVGSSIAPGVYGGLERHGEDWSAMSIDAASGEGVPDDGGQIKFADTLGAAAKTLGAALGLGDEFLDEAITAGRVIAGALA